MPHPYPCIESMTTLRVPQEAWTIRVWREEEELQETYDNRDLSGAVFEFIRQDVPFRRKMVLAELLAALPRVNAVEVKDADGNGLVVYKNWP